jgi:hypothetical protein
MDTEKEAFEQFKAHMMVEVIPVLLEGAISTNEEAEMLISAQWKEMPSAEKDSWLNKVQKIENAGSHS